MRLVWEQVGVNLLIYGIFMIFFGILGAGSLNYFAAISGASEPRLREFLNDLRFPFRTLIEIYYGAPQEKVISLILKATPKSALAMRVLGGLFPMLFIAASVMNLMGYSHSDLEVVSGSVPGFFCDFREGQFKPGLGGATDRMSPARTSDV